MIFNHGHKRGVIMQLACDGGWFGDIFGADSISGSFCLD